MKILDTIKNALFEVEYVEVPADPKKAKKEKKENDSEDAKDKPIAKKVLLSRPRAPKEEKKEPEVMEEPAPISSENVNREQEHSFKVMNDKDFKMDEEEHYNPEPKEESYDSNTYSQRETRNSRYEDSYENSNSYEEERPYEKPQPREEYNPPREEESRVIYREPVRERYSTPYGIDDASRNLVPEYGRSAYEKKEEKGGFKPSPIISPIYGVLDKNYRKEDVVQKKEVRISSYSRENVNVDDVRNKALGVTVERKAEEPKATKKLEEEIIEEEDDNLLVDLSKDEDKPSVKEVTMGDAMEYFQDLGLEYNVDYVDASKEKSTPRRVKDNYNEEPEMFPIDEEKETVKEEVKEEPKKEEKKPPVVDEELDNDDNLFDLIENMYQDK